MSFFSKKKGDGLNLSPSSAVAGKIHTMQQDLENAKNQTSPDSPNQLDQIRVQQREQLASFDSPQTLSGPFSTAPISQGAEKPESPSIDSRPVDEQKTSPVHIVREAKENSQLSSKSSSIGQEPFNPSRIKRVSGNENNPKSRYSQASENFSHTTREKSKVSNENLRTGTWPVEESNQQMKRIDSSAKGKPEQEKKSDLFTENVVLRASRRHQLAWIAVGIVTLSLLGGGGYYFWSTRQSNTFVPEITSRDTPQNTPEEIPSNQTDKNLPFSTENPNPFLVDVETETVSMLQSRLLKEADTMKKASMNGPVPFSVVDKTNTPIAFFVFASIFNLGLSNDLLNSLGNNFRLYLVLDQGNPRVVLSIEAKDAEKVRSEILLAERSLPISAKNIFLNQNVTVPQTAEFKDSSHQNTPIRYFNIPGEESFSIDYGFLGNTLVIGTSKSSVRSVLDLNNSSSQSGIQ